MRFRELGVCLMAVSMLAGCGTLSGNGNAPAATSNHAIKIGYRLPERQFQAEVTYQLRECAIDDNGDLNFTAKVGANLSPSIVTSDEEFSFDPMLVPNARVAQNLTVSLYPNSTVKEINATSEDKTASIIGGFFKFVGGIVKTFAGLGLDSDAAEAIQLCTEDTMKNLAAVDLLKKVLKAKQSGLIEELTKDPSEARSKVIAAYGVTIEGLKSEIAKIRTNRLTITKKHIVEAKSVTNRQAFTLKREDLHKWLSADGYRRVLGAEKKKWKDNNWGDAPKLPVLRLELYLKGGDPGAKSKALKSVDVANDYKNRLDQIIVRRPKQTKFELCMSTCVDDNNAATNTKRLSSGTTTVPQWSEPQSIAFNVAMFEKRVLKMSFADDGKVSLLTLDRPAKADAVANAFANIAEGAATLVDTVQFAGQNAEIKQLETETKLLTSQIALKDAKEAYLKAFSTDEDAAADEPGP